MTDFQGGSNISEPELYGHMVHYTQKLGECYRGMAHKRGQEKWLLLARLMGEIEHNTKLLMFAKDEPYKIPGYRRE